MLRSMTIPARVRCLAGVLALSSIAAVTALLAQSSRATITGIVTDPSKAGLAYAPSLDSGSPREVIRLIQQ
jgi:hypothetical protein